MYVCMYVCITFPLSPLSEGLDPPLFLQVPSSQKNQRNQTIELSWGLYCLVVFFLLLYVICALVATERTIASES